MNKFCNAVLKVASTVKRLSKRFDADNLTAFAAQAAFFVFIALFPFAMVILNLLNYIPGLQGIVFSDHELFFISPAVSELIKAIFTEAGEKGSGALLSITSVAALWASSKGVIGIINGLNSIYKTTEKRSYIRLRLTALLYTVVFLLILLLVLVFLVFGNSLLHFLVSLVPPLVEVSLLLKIARWLVGMMLLVMFFMFLYTVIPERKTRMRNELPGAVISAVGWMGFSALYSFYIDNIANYANIYGSLTAIVLLMLWLYFCMVILFFGAEINDILRTHGIGGFIKRQLAKKRITGKVKMQKAKRKDNGK